APTTATNDAVLTIAPPPARRRAGMPYLHPKKTPLALMFIVRSHTDSSVDTASSSWLCMMPALLNRMLSCPYSLSAFAIMRSHSLTLLLNRRGPLHPAWRPALRWRFVASSVPAAHCVQMTTARSALARHSRRAAEAARGGGGSRLLPAALPRRSIGRSEGAKA